MEKIFPYIGKVGKSISGLELTISRYEASRLPECQGKKYNMDHIQRNDAYFHRF